MTVRILLTKLVFFLPWKVCERVRQNGEPGFAWLDNMRSYGRMADGKNDLDKNAMGGNPCLEQTLESFEMCCLVETFPDKHESLEDFAETLRWVERDWKFSLLLLLLLYLPSPPNTAA